MGTVLFSRYKCVGSVMALLIVLVQDQYWLITGSDTIPAPDQHRYGTSMVLFKCQCFPFFFFFKFHDSCLPYWNRYFLWKHWPAQWTWLLLLFLNTSWLKQYNIRDLSHFISTTILNKNKPYYNDLHFCSPALNEVNNFDKSITQVWF